MTEKREEFSRQKENLAEIKREYDREKKKNVQDKKKV